MFSSTSSSLFCVWCFCYCPPQYKYCPPNTSSMCLMYVSLIFLFFKVWLDKTSTFPEICKWDIRSIRPWRSFNTDYFCIRWKPFWVPRQPAVFSPLWQRLPSVHAQLPLLREGPGSAAETGQGPTGKCICGCRWRFWALKLWHAAAAANVVVFQLNISSLSLDLGNVIVLHKHKTGVQRDDSQQFQ